MSLNDSALTAYIKEVHDSSRSLVTISQAGAVVVDMQTADRWRDPKILVHHARAELAGGSAADRFRYGE